MPKRILIHTSTDYVIIALGMSFFSWKL